MTASEFNYITEKLAQLVDTPYQHVSRATEYLGIVRGILQGLLDYKNPEYYEKGIETVIELIDDVLGEIKGEKQE